jgi:exodeoxyribonuclease VII large subunit
MWTLSLQLISSIRSRPVLASPFGFIDAQQEQLSMLTRRIREIFDYRLKVSASEIKELRASANALSPKLTLERGYSVLMDEKGNRVSKLAKGSKFTVITKDQEISASAVEVKERDV